MNGHLSPNPDNTVVYSLQPPEQKRARAVEQPLSRMLLVLTVFNLTPFAPPQFVLEPAFTGTSNTLLLSQYWLVENSK